MNKNADRTKKTGILVISTCLLLFLVLLAIPVIAQHMSKSISKSKAQLADDTLIVLTAKGADLNKVYETLAAANCRVLQTVNVKKGGYFLISVKPEPGKLVETENKILATSDKHIKAVRRNYLDHFQQCPPDDPEFPGQWALTTQRFPEALCPVFSGEVPQITYPRVTLIDTGVYPVQLGDEMNWIQQFNFVLPANGQPESPFDTGTHGTGVTGVAAAMTYNATNMAGISSAYWPALITMCRASSNGSDVDRQWLYNALAWCVDNQEIRGGPGPINLSANASPPNTFNADPIMQTLAQTLYENGDLLVNGAGNSGLEDSSPDQYIRRVAGTDQDNLLWVNSVYGSFDTAAPAVNILTYLYPWELSFRTGTSFAAPHWAGAIAFIISLVPGLPAGWADWIIYDTATVTDRGDHIPNLEAAVQILRRGGAAGGPNGWRSPPPKLSGKQPANTPG